MVDALDFSAPETWDHLVMSDPAAALDAAQRCLAAATGELSAISALARHAAAKASFELGRSAEALAHSTRALQDAEQLHREDLRWEIGMTQAVILAQSGRMAEGFRVLESLEEHADDASLGRIRLQQAYLLHAAGRLVEAMARIDEGDRILSAGAQPRDRLRISLNRGLLMLEQGRLDEAERELNDAIVIARELDSTMYEAMCQNNLAVVHGRSRRLAMSLASFDRAERCYELAGSPSRPMATMFVDRAELAMHSGLVDQAVTAARSAYEAASASRNDLLVGDALLMRARTELRAGLVRQAERSAQIAHDQFVATGRDDMAAHAEAVAVVARLHDPVDATAAAAIGESALLAARLRLLGWHEPADGLAAERIRTAWRLGTWDSVADDLADLRLHAWGVRRDLALLGWFAEAVARSLAGDPRGSVEACTKGLDFLDEITAEATDLEARSAAMRLGDDLSQWLIEVAVDQHEPGLVLAASEGTRARALHEELDARDRHRPLTEAGAELLRTELRSRLRGRSLLQWIVAGERVHAVVCDETGNRLVDVADLRSVVRERDRLIVWLDRAAAEPDDSSARAARAAKLLDELLLAPLDLPAERSVVIVPVDELHGVPWSGLPSIADRPVLLSPSCRLWLDADRRSSAPIRTVGFVSGPNLAADDLERSTLRRSCDRLDEATGPGAAAATVRTMFGGHDLVHVAAHGRFRGDRPLLSTFELADGEVTLHEAVPERVGTRLAVLSSCEGGAHRGTGGSEVLGFASVLLARGAASVLAPLTVVRDLECGEYVAAVHEEMATGIRFGLAVANVRSRWLRDDDLSRWAVASSFTCFGSGATRRAL